MDTVRRKRRDFLQNIAIVVLTLSAVALFVQTQLYNLNQDNDYFRSLSAGSTASQSTPTSLADLSAPVRIAVTGDYGHYGNVQMTTTDKAFTESLRSLLRGALGSAQTFTPCSGEEFLSAISGVSIYYDFLNPLPLSVLAGLVGEATDNETISARQLVLADRGEDGVRLYLSDGSTYLSCSVAVSASRLADTVSSYELGGAFFAFESTEAEPLFASLAPCSLFLNPLPQVSALSAKTPLSDTDWLLSALGFNPNTKSRYTESSGTEVIIRGDCSLRIRSDGTVSYDGGSTPTLQISAQEDATVNQRILAVQSLLNSIFSNFSSDASLYLVSVQASGSSMVLRFGYQVEGVPIRFSNNADAAMVTLSGSDVTALTLRIRQYSHTGEVASLLPLRQSLAIAAQTPGGELSIGYTDRGGDTADASWLLD